MEDKMSRMESKNSQLETQFQELQEEFATKLTQLESKVQEQEMLLNALQRPTALNSVQMNNDIIDIFIWQVVIHWKENWFVSITINL